MHYAVAAQFLRTAIPDIIGSYKNGLRAVRSPLVTHKEAWPRCRDQAQSIVEDCIRALLGEPPAELAEARDYSRLVGADRAAQGIAVAESVRAVDILWSAMQPALRTAVQYEAAARRTSALLLINTAFWSSTGSRLYAGARAYADVSQRAPRELVHTGAGAGPVAGFAGGRTEKGVAALGTPTCGDLSRREKEVLERVAMARSNVQIARELGIETATVKRHLSNIYGKLQAGSRIEAVNKAFGRV
ncbi:helix-turn-helix transcriptional regulator [Streptomyces fuscigenes]|uniref:helix-turn-helix transcriptional regulator n=1 Tax=Streptomyces fuscigenes TaxID=1528880 RepID=UPI001F3CD717|nr:helix-turn-helix transcriptional regulator [Streptomyces fuscigenes]MCF3960696.1 LuxR C-terminal-related transcriptional regulator [Streptomyces fuscigenes]